MGSLFQGHAVGGVITAVLNIISIALSDGKIDSPPSKSAFICFLVATVFIVLDTLALMAMTKIKFYEVSILLTFDQG